MEDGLLCRSDQDCMWLDEGLRCTDYKIDWSVATDWFNGDSASIVGSCDCLEGFWYAEDQISCIVSLKYKCHINAKQFSILGVF